MGLYGNNNYWRFKVKIKTSADNAQQLGGK